MVSHPKASLVFGCQGVHDGAVEVGRSPQSGTIEAGLLQLPCLEPGPILEHE